MVYIQFHVKIIILVILVIMCTYCVINIIDTNKREAENNIRLNELAGNLSILSRSYLKNDDDGITGKADYELRASAIENRKVQANNWQKSFHQYSTRGQHSGEKSDKEMGISRMEDLIFMFGIMKNDTNTYVGDSRFAKAKELYDMLTVKRVKEEEEKRKSKLKLKISQIQDKLAKKSFRAQPVSL